VTTLIGNPGQGNYVAANAFMEGLARRRRQEGRPALAIGWGPISDVGVVARTEKLQSNLNKVGTRGMTAREALELMAQALGEASDLVDEGVITIAPYDSALRSDLLPVLKSPTYSGLISRHHGESGSGDKIDLRGLLKSTDIEVVRQTVADVVVAELARVLHFREEDVGRARPLADLGLDSLMALELVMNLEERFGVRFTLAGSSANLTVTSVTNEIIAQVNPDDAARGGLVERSCPFEACEEKAGLTRTAETPRIHAQAIVMAERHLENVGSEELGLLTALIDSERPKMEGVQS
jgi:phthiocerol/phenolphthiocerol synthesis type-I polyketide synthase C